jgi:hypothetical protein
VLGQLASAGHQHHRQIRPGRLVDEQILQQDGSLRHQGFLGEQQRAGALADAVHDLDEIAARLRDDSGLAEDLAGEDGVLPGRGEDEHPLRRLDRIPARGDHDDSRAFWDSTRRVGIPESTPWNCVNGLPTWMPS